MDVCDPDAKTKNIRKLIKLHTGRTVDVPRERMCDITREAKKGNLPMPPLVLTRDKRFLLDPKSPLTQKDYETLYKSNVTSAVVKRLAKKVGLVNTDKTISELKDAIGRRLASTSVREPILLPGTRMVSTSRSPNFFANTVRNQDQNQNQDQDRNRNRNINSAGRNGTRPNETRPKSVNNAIRNRHRDRIKSFRNNRREANRREGNRREPNEKKPGFFGRIFRGSKNTSTNKLNAEVKLAQMKRNTQRQMSHHRAVQSRLRLREAKLAKNRISEAERIKRQAINDVTRMQNNKHLLEVELNRRQNKGRRNAEALGQSRRELAKEKLHAGELNTRIAALRRGAIQAREQAKKNLKETKEALRLAMNKITDKTKNINLKQSEIKKAKENLNAASKKANAYKESTDTALAKIQELTKQLETAGNAGNSEKVKTLEAQINTLTKELEEAKKKPVTIVQNAELIAKKIELTRKAAEAGLKFSKNINALTMNNLRGTVVKNNFGKNTQVKLAPKVLALENKIKAAAEAKANAESRRLEKIEEERREEMNRIRREKENAITAAAAEKATAVKEAEEAAKAKAMANTAEEMAAAQAKLNAAQAKIKTADANKTNALAKAKEERNAALAAAAKNKANALAAANTAAKANKNAALTNAAKKAKINRNMATRNAAQKARERQKAENNVKRIANIKNATQKARERQRMENQARMNEITEEKNKAIALAAANKANALAKAKLEQEQAVKNARNAQKRLNDAASASEKAKAKANLNQAKQDLANAAKNKANALAKAEKDKANALAKAKKNKNEATALAAQKARERQKEENNAKRIANIKNATQKARERQKAENQAKMNEITEEKNKAIAAAAANRNKAKTEANAARKALAAGRFQSAANKAALEKKLKTAEENIKKAATQKVEALMKAANEKKELQRKAEENKQAAMKGAVVVNRMKGAVNAKKAAQNRMAAILKKRAQAARNSVAEKKKKAQDELRALAAKEEVNFTRNINRVTLNGVNTLKTRIKNAGKAKRIAKAKADGEAKRLARQKANKNRENQNARNAEANKVATARRIALEKKQAAAKQRRETQEKAATEVRAKRNAEREAAKANAKKEKNNMNARMKATRNKLTENKAKNALINARIAYRMNVLMAAREGRLPQNQKDYWTRQANTAMNMSTIQGVDKMFKIHLEKLKREKNAATKIQAAFKGGQVRKSVGGSSMGKDILKKHISGVDVMAGQKIPGFSGKRVEDKGYERDWIKRVDEEGDTAVKRAKLKKMFDDKFKLKMNLLQNEQSNVRKGYKLGGIKAMKTQVMRPRYKQDQSTKGTDQNLAIQNVKDIKEAIQEARIKASMNRISNNPMATNNRMPKKTFSNPLFNASGGFNGGIRLGSGGNKAINGSNVKITFKPSLKNITQKKIIRPARMAGNTLIKAGQITQAKKNAVGNVVAARKAYTNQSKFALNQRKARAKKRVELSLTDNKGVLHAGKNADKYKKMINEGKINDAMKKVDDKVLQLQTKMKVKVKKQPKLT